MTSKGRRTPRSSVAASSENDGPAERYRRAEERVSRLERREGGRAKAPPTSSGGLGDEKRRRLLEEADETGKSAIDSGDRESGAPPPVGMRGNLEVELGRLERGLLLKGIGAVGFLVVLLLSLFAMVRDDIGDIRGEVRSSVENAKQDFRDDLTGLRNRLDEQERRLREAERDRARPK